MVEGVIDDQNGTAIAGATIKIRQVGTNAEISSTTDSDGRYRVRGLPQGLYSITIEAPGFQKTNIGGVTVAAGRTTNNNAALRVGSITESVEIRGEAVIVVSAIQSSGKENVGKENNKSSIFLSYIFLSAGRNDDHGPRRHTAIGYRRFDSVSQFNEGRKLRCRHSH